MYNICTENEHKTFNSCSVNVQEMCIKGAKKMKSIVFLNQKGGVGKTLLSDEVAFCLEQKSKVCFIDLDMQGGAIHQTNYEEGQEYDYQIIDTPGALQKDTREYMNQADLVIIPTKCNRQDMEALERMMKIAEDFDKNKFIIVFNQWNRFNGTAEFINWFNFSYPGYKTFLIPSSVVLTDAAARSMSVTDYSPKHKAAIAVNEFVKLILKSIGE
jgi:chromosome partitioning protein